MTSKKRVLITGASSGVGQATARLLSEHGHKVLGTSRHPSKADRIENVEILPLDVRSDEAVRACVEAAGPIDVLVNNAGYELAGALEEVSIEEAQAQFETNFFGVARMVKAVLPYMRQRKQGQIINISSLAGLSPIPFMGFYSASKFALEGYTEALRHEVRPFNIQVSQIEVGFLNTAMSEHRQMVGEEIADYHPWRQRALTAIAAVEERGPKAQLVAEAIGRVVVSRKPRLRYVIGKEAVVVSHLRRWLHESAFEKGVRRNFRLDERK